MLKVGDKVLLLKEDFNRVPFLKSLEGKVLEVGFVSHHQLVLLKGYEHLGYFCRERFSLPLSTEKSVEDFL